MGRMGRIPQVSHAWWVERFSFKECRVIKDIMSLLSKIARLRMTTNERNWRACSTRHDFRVEVNGLSKRHLLPSF